MTYYEELGLTPAASAEEVRLAYKNLVRLLHPDQFQDESLRRAAGLQMMRLNAVVAVLSDPVERRRYDRSLAPGPVAVLGRCRVPVAVSLRAVRRSWAWWVAAGIGLATMVFLAAGGAEPEGTPPAALAKTPLAAPARTGTTPSARGRGLKAPLRQARRRNPGPRAAKLTAAPRLTARPAPLRPELPPAVLPPGLLLVEQPAPAPPRPTHAAVASASPAAAATPETPAVADLAGTWLYVSRNGPRREETLYPPEYIELRIGEEAGRILGRYRARYLIPDRPISPEVNFYFEGAAGAEEFRWTGSGGASGEVRLKRRAADSLEVAWWASELGRSLGLASGTAVLMRR
ncbi:MAG: DnaJ domain-containing protein [Acidobacteriota bacterium]